MCTITQRFYKKKYIYIYIFCVHTTLIILLISLLYFVFLFFHLCSSVSLIFSTLSFSSSFLFSKLSFFSNFSLKFFSFSSQIFSQILFFFFSNFLCFFSIFSLLCEGLFFCRVGVGVVGHRRHDRVVGIMSHRFWVMPWVWWVIIFGSCHECGLPWVLFLWLWVDFLG